MPQRVIMHIDADAFFASVEQGFNPQLRNRPVIVGGIAEQRGVVHTASYEARERGIRTGMPLVKAKTICPDAVFLKGDYAHYRAVGEVLQEVYLRYTPRVEFTSLDDAYLDLTGTEHIHESPTWVARCISDEVQRRVGVSISIGIAGSKMIARIASGMYKPRGIAHITPDHEMEFLGKLPVDQLPGIGRMAKEKLTDLHIFKVAELARLPRIIVEQLFGKNGITIWKMANGIDEREVKTKVIPRQISRETSFPEDTSDLGIIKGSMQYLAERVALTLRRDQLTCRTVGIRLAYSDFSRVGRSRSMEIASDDPADIYAQAEQLFDALTLRRVRIRHIGVSVTQIRPRNEQAFLFSERSRKESLNSAIDELRDRFGFMAVMPADTLKLKSRYRNDAHGYILHNPALTR